MSPLTPRDTCLPYPRYDFPRNAEWVPTDVMWSLREYDRRTTDKARVDRIAESLRRFGFTSPVIITYHQHERTVLLGEGNHRVAAARQAGLPYVLARVWRISQEYGPRHHTSRRPVPVRGVDPDRFGYVKADLKPSEVGLPSKPLTAVEIALDGMRIPGAPDWD